VSGKPAGKRKTADLGVDGKIIILRLLGQ